MASVTVDIDIDEFDDADVVCAAKERGYRVMVSNEQLNKFHEWDREKIRRLEIEEFEARTVREDLAVILEAVKQGRAADAIAFIEVLMFPKFKTRTDCEKRYSEIISTVAR